MFREPLFEEQRTERQPRVAGPWRVMERVIDKTPDPLKWWKIPPLTLSEGGKCMIVIKGHQEAQTEVVKFLHKQ